MAAMRKRPNSRCRGALWRAAAGMLCAAAAGSAAAGSFSISPIRGDLGNAHRTEVFTLRNEDDAPVLIQVTAAAWSQESGEEQFHDTAELLTTPPVFKIGPRGEQIVRVALRRAVDPMRELSYRLFFQEVPQASTPTVNGLSVALRLSVPVFVGPARAANADLQWALREAADGSMRIEVSNRGSAHEHISDFDVQFDAAAAAHISLARYVLPGGRASWTFKPPSRAPDSGRILVHGYADAGEFSTEVARVGS